MHQIEIGELLIAAKKYCVESLKELCEVAICNILINNVIKYLELAIVNRADKIKKEALERITFSWDVIKKEGFAEFRKQCPEVLIKIMKWANYCIKISETKFCWLFLFIDMFT